MSGRKAGQCCQQPGYIFPVVVVNPGQQAGQLSPAPANADTGEFEHVCWSRLTNTSSKT